MRRDKKIPEEDETLTTIFTQRVPDSSAGEQMMIEASIE